VPTRPQYAALPPSRATATLAFAAMPPPHSVKPEASTLSAPMESPPPGRWRRARTYLADDAGHSGSCGTTGARDRRPRVDTARRRGTATP
jgi:hypothetical protein